MPDERTPTTSDALLRELSARPDSPRAAEFVRLYGPVLRRFAEQSRSGHRPIPPADRDDLVQEALVAVRRALPGFRYDPARGRFRAYLRRIVRNLAIRHQEARERDEALASALAADPPPPPDPDDALRLRAWTLALARVLDSGRFAPNTAAAFRRFAVDGAPAEAVAAEFGMKANAVYQLRSRVLRAVREELRRAGHGRLSLDDLCTALEDGG